ncbi:MAG: hypothetical protein ACR2LK_03120 [Solirubrobacteraceae bacterium]
MTIHTGRANTSSIHQHDTIQATREDASRAPAPRATPPRTGERQDDLVVCVLRGGFSQVEQTLLELVFVAGQVDTAAHELLAYA